MSKAFAIAGLVLAHLAAPAMAQSNATECASISDSNLPDDLAGWAAEPVSAVAANSAAMQAPLLEPSQRASVTLHPAASVALALAPEQVRTPDDAHAGLLTFRVEADGVWRVSASKGVWIDVLADGERINSTAFGQLAPCTSIRKVVEFPLTAGDYLLQLSGNPGATIDVMISPKP